MNKAFRLFLLAAFTGLPLWEGLWGQEQMKFIPSYSSAGKYAAPKAINPASIRLGFCDDGNGGSLKLVSSVPQTYGGAVFFPAQVLDKYEGDRIDSVLFAIAPRRGLSATVFVTAELGEAPLASAVTSDYQEGWNRVKLDKSVTIVKGRPLYIGYYITLAPGDEPDFLRFDLGDYTASGRNWTGVDGVWHMATGLPKDLSLRAILSGDNRPVNDVALDYIKVEEGGYVEQNKPLTYVVNVRNFGTNTVNTVDFGLSARGVASNHVVLDNLAIAPNKNVRLTVPGLKVPVEGNFDATVTALTVNETADSDPSDNAVTRSTGYAYKEGTAPLQRNVLFEEFTSEGFEDCPIADATYAKAIGKRSDVVWVKHHRNYGNYTDKFVLDAEKPYFELFSDGKTFVPAIAIDRRSFNGMEDPGPAYFVANNVQTGKMIDAAAAMPAFASLDAQAERSQSGQQLNVEVTVKATTNEMPLQKDLRLTAWLVEDSIVSTTQAGASEGYMQNGVVRAVLSSNAWGDPVEIGNYETSTSYSTLLDPSWNVSNLRVVAFLCNYDADVFQRFIYNSVEKAIGRSLGISNATPEKQPKVAIANGSLVAPYGFSLLGVFDLSGRQMSASSLSPGTYVVKLTNGHKFFTQKIIISQ